MERPRTMEVKYGTKMTTRTDIWTYEYAKQTIYSRYIPVYFHNLLYVLFTIVYLLWLKNSYNIRLCNANYSLLHYCVYLIKYVLFLLIIPIRINCSFSVHLSYAYCCLTRYNVFLIIYFLFLLSILIPFYFPLIIHVYISNHCAGYSCLFFIAYSFFFHSFVLFMFLLCCVCVIHLFLVNHHDYRYNRVFLISYILFFLSNTFFLIPFRIIHLFVAAYHDCGKQRSLYITLFHQSVLILRYSYINKLRQLTSCLMRARRSRTYRLYMHMNDNLIVFLDIPCLI